MMVKTFQFIIYLGHVNVKSPKHVCFNNGANESLSTIDFRAREITVKFLSLLNRINVMFFLSINLNKFCFLRTKQLIKIFLIIYCCLGVASYMGLNCSPHVPTRSSHNQFNSPTTTT